MSGSDFDDVFGAHPIRAPGFADRLRPREPLQGISAKAPIIDHASASADYRAFGFLPTGVGETCDVQRWMDRTVTPEGIEFQYRFLMQVGYVGDEHLKLFLPDCIVVIEGRRLRELRQKLARRQFTFIQQYSPMVWRGPDPDQAVVDSIAVMRPQADGRA